MRKTPHEVGTPPTRLRAESRPHTILAKTRMSDRPQSSVQRLLRDTRGQATTEYVVLVGMMGLAVVFALITVGPKLVRDFERARNITASPIP